MSDSWPPALMERLSAIDRENAASLTSQLVDLFVEAIANGELAPGAKLPPTRTPRRPRGHQPADGEPLLPAARDDGRVVSEVGRGTFVRAGVAASHRVERADDVSWQSYALPRERVSEGDRIIGDIARHAEESSTSSRFPRATPRST